MQEKNLHIISFNNPYPPDYGGVIDIFYKIRALHERGVRIILHSFSYGRKPSKELERYCLRVFYYDRGSGPRHFLSRTPYIVQTRSSKIMPERILGDRYPVLFEGLHSTALLPFCSSAGKKTLVRAHNIEHHYYRSLARSEQKWRDKAFFIAESVKLRSYEQVLENADHILGISRSETRYFEERFGNAHFVPAFHRFDEVETQPGQGDYILYHGNLGVAENSDVFLRIAKHVLSQSSHRVIVAGKNPSRSFLRQLEKWPRIELVANPDDASMDDLILNAQVNLLYTSQATGIKLKLLHALFAGRHCLVNREMVEGTGLEELCVRADQPGDMTRELDRLMKLPFGKEQVAQRKSALKKYSNRANAERILSLLD